MRHARPLLPSRQAQLFIHSSFHCRPLAHPSLRARPLQPSPFHQPRSITVRCSSAAASRPLLPSRALGAAGGRARTQSPKNTLPFSFPCARFPSSNCGCTRPGTDVACPSSPPYCVRLSSPTFPVAARSRGGCPQAAVPLLRAEQPLCAQQMPRLPPTSRNPLVLLSVTASPEPILPLPSAPDPCPPISYPPENSGDVSFPTPPISAALQPLAATRLSH